MASDLPDTPLPEAVTRVEAAGFGLLGIGIPRCPASALLSASLSVLAAEDERATVVMSTLATAEDWSARESHLWPRGIRVSRASVPAVARYADGTWSTRQGTAPVDVLRGWLHGEAAAAGELHEDEKRVLADTAARRAQHEAARNRGIRRSAE